jgi:MinD superfamily P-loop ATPase
MHELVILSGKGGTGKTSLVASLAALARPVVAADGDVDASDLHLILAPDVQQRTDFFSGQEAIIRQEDCLGCGACLAHCRFDAVLRIGGPEDDFLNSGKSTCDRCADGCRRSCPVKSADLIEAIKAAVDQQTKSDFFIDPTGCEGCGVCGLVCPSQAITFRDRLCGEWFLSRSRHGPLVHARMRPAAENSGKLVHLVRDRARSLATEHGLDLILVDGPPGIGCPAIAALTGTDLAVLVSEPTPSGAHDLARILELAQHFRIPTAVCINKADLHPALAQEMEERSRAGGSHILDRIPYDPAVTAAQRQGLAVTEASPASPATLAMSRIWQDLRSLLASSVPSIPVPRSSP